MAQKNNYREYHGKTKKNVSQNLVFPKYQSQKKRHSGMPGEEKVITRKNAIKPWVRKEGGVNDHAGRERANVGKAHKARPDNCKKRDTFHYKRRVIRFP